MSSEKYINKKGIERYKLAMTAAEMSHIMFAGEGQGFCIGCGEDADGCEPDARNYECGACGERLVFGIEELLTMGLVRITDDEPAAAVVSPVVSPEVGA